MTAEGHDAGPGREGSGAGLQDVDNNRPSDTLAENKKCPACGAPVDDVRATCIDCGYEYKDEDHEDPDAGTEFVSGSQIDEQGNELLDEEPPAASTQDDPGEQQ